MSTELVQEAPIVEAIPEIKPKKIYPSKMSDKIKEYNKSHYAKIKEVIKEKGATKIYCVACDKHVSKSGFRVHLKALNHIKKSQMITIANTLSFDNKEI